LSLEGILTLTETLIAERSISGSETIALEIMEKELISKGFKTERLEIPNDTRWNLLAFVEQPRIILTTHLDVVPAQDELFVPTRKENRLWGRGSCDAKGIAATMVYAASELKAKGRKDVGLLFVVDEETVSTGAKAAAPELKKRGVEFIINGEPTMCQLVSGHKGALTVVIKFRGKPAHSGYPHLGDDANHKLIRACSELMQADFGTSELLGSATINLGVIEGGVATNMISPKSRVKALVRTVTSNTQVLEKIKAICPDADAIEVIGNSEPVFLHTVPGFDPVPVSYGTDVPYLMASGAKCLLYGPGTIEVAHTNFESVEFEQLEKAFLGYQEIVTKL
jgi:acetylornithine deacetylase